MMANFEIDPTTWLADRVPRFHELPDGEKKAIGDFCLLWGLFEGRCLDERASISKIERFVSVIAPALEQDRRFLDSTLRYFQDRYVAPGDDFTDRFEQLQFGNGDRRRDVEAVLIGHQTDKQAVLVALLIIVYRFRNNLFHGQKWQYELSEQLDNFSTANRLLMKAMDLSGIFQETGES
ncbi:hypothetical protein [Pararhizobium sp. IMCC21322]|uniref:hypothetical protein n=1 Tax=Pararhizobium sp. IMCC21322 TaxID=3067903 RepID=UPI002740F47B|nr:hypothetical protein [Pararhizobium sp. IMCC21322]